MSAPAGRPRPLEVLREHLGEVAHDYDGPRSQTLGGYVAVLTAYGTVAAGGLALAARSGRLPERVPAADLVLFGVATHKVARTLTKDSVTTPIRAPFTRYVGVAGPAERQERPRRHGPARAVGELLSCPFCAGQWIATGFVLGSLGAPRVTRTVAGIFAVRALADWLQFATSALDRVARGPAPGDGAGSPEPDRGHR